MKYLKQLIGATGIVCCAFSSHGALVSHFPMDVRSGQIIDEISGWRYEVQGNFAPENVAGAVGKALRFDGYTSYVEAALGDISASNTGCMTVSLWVALQCYPTVQIDVETTDQIAIASCLDNDAKTGFGFYIDKNGAWSFKTFVGGWPLTLNADTAMPVNKWNCLTAVLDKSDRTLKLYLDGKVVAQSRANGTLSMASRSTLRIGHDAEQNFSGPFALGSFNGLIDEIKIWDEALPQSTISGWTAENEADLSIPSSRFESDLLRPRFHGMPEAAWTNECHGMYYSNGRYHLFFQKNANGPYMARLHWGHISSENLYDWREEPIAIAPSDWFDSKGCWSGCIFSDDVITGGRPSILYTGVDYARARIVQANTADNSLTGWTKAAPVINGRPDGLSDDFRDPYFFRNGDDAYIIVGSSKNGIGTTTLHKYNATTRNWSNDGQLFFTGTSAAQDGTFWEMPNVTQMPDGKWLFTATPLGTSQGVRTLYWTGSIAADGKFVTDANSSRPRLVELNSRDGFGLLSPTVYQHGGKTIAMGIVPDKLPSTSNWRLGWAHCYSLPREWSLASDGSLVQKPYEALTGLRSDTRFSKSDFSLSGSMPLDPVNGRSAEICATFEVGTSTFGFKIFKTASAEAVISYTPSTSELTVDFSALPRLTNDGGVYDGVYRCYLPERLAIGSEMKLNIFIDHSILDIFVNDKWATSIRVFPTEADANGIEAYSTAATKVKDLKAWNLSVDASQSSIDGIWSDSDSQESPYVDVYNLQGVKILANVLRETATDNLPGGFYIVGNRKVLVR